MTTWPDTRLLDLLQIEHPIIQAPMAGSATPALAAAASNAGALGSLGCAMMDTGAVRGAVGELRDRSNRAFNLNFFCHAPPGHDPARDARAAELLAPFYRELGLGEMPAALATNFPFGEEMLELLLELRPQVASFHFGLPDEALVRPLKDAGVVILSSATTPGEARRLEAMGVDAIIAQGFEAGGHRGHFAAPYESTWIGTLALVPQVVDAVRVPVIAAGGIADGRGIAAALAAASGEDTAMTRAFSGRPARGIRNRYLDAMAPHEETLPDFPLMNTLAGPLRKACAARGSGDFIALWAGQAVGLNRTLPAAELVETLVAETRARLAAVAG